MVRNETSTTGWPAAPPYAELAALGNAALDVWLGSHLPDAGRRRKAWLRLQALVRLARSKAPLYRHLYRQLPQNTELPLEALPVVTKSMLMDDLAASLTDRTLSCADLEAFAADPKRVGELLAGRYAVWSSSGTTGRPGLFVHDMPAVALYQALETLRYRGLNSLLEYGARVAAGERFALVAVTGGHFAGISSLEHLRRSYPWLASSAMSFSLFAPLRELVAGLNAYQPTVLATYPTAAETLAREQETGRLALHLSEMLTGGECLSPQTRDRLERVFRCRVRNGYGASEFMSIAWSCPRGALHVNDDWVLLEAVDAAHRPVPAGTASHTTLVTNLANRAQPLIRYDLGDSITWLPPCGCGSTFPCLQVEGRHDDVLHLRNAAGDSHEVLPLILATVIEEGADIYDFQVTQTGASQLRVALRDRDRTTQQRVRAALLAHFSGIALHGVRISFSAQPPQASPVSGKLRRIVYAAADTGPSRTGCASDAQSVV